MVGHSGAGSAKIITASLYMAELENRDRRTSLSTKAQDLNVESLLARDLLNNEWKQKKQNPLPLEIVAPSPC
jgi:hypothetical protein